MSPSSAKFNGAGGSKGNSPSPLRTKSGHAPPLQRAKKVADESPIARSQDAFYLEFRHHGRTLIQASVAERPIALPPED